MSYQLIRLMEQEQIRMFSLKMLINYYFFTFQAQNCANCGRPLRKCSKMQFAGEHSSNFRTTHASGLMDRNGNICQKCRKRGDLKLQQLAWVANMTRIMHLAVRLLSPTIKSVRGLLICVRLLVRPFIRKTHTISQTALAQFLRNLGE